MKLVIFGIGALADLARYYFDTDTSYEVVGFTVDGDYITEDTHGGLPLVAFEDLEAHFPAANHTVFIAIGYTGLNAIRQQKCDALRQKGYTLASYVSSRATDLSERKGENCFVFESAVLQPFSAIGDGVIIWPGTVVAHHAKIGDFVYLSPNATISGGAVIGDRCFVGAGAAVRDAIKISPDTLLAIGSVTVADLERPGIYTGLPARLRGPVTPQTVI